MSKITKNSHGVWVGYYPGHFDQEVEIVQEGPVIRAIKLSGDDYVPAGVDTWMIDLRTMTVLGRIAEKEYINTRYVPAEVAILSKDKIKVTWIFDDGTRGAVIYRRDGV